jgi:protein SCO1/2
MKRAATLALALLCALQLVRAAAERYPVTGMVLQVDRANRTFAAAIDAIPTFMPAMTMTFRVKDAKELAGLAPGAVVEFTLVVDKSSSFAEAVRVRHYQGLEQDPLAARRLSLLKEVAGRPAARPLAIGAAVPDFTLIDQKARKVSLSQFRGKVVAMNFMYTTCQLPDFCLRIVNHFGALQKTFKAELGRDLVFLTATFDPVRDQPEVLDRYASQWSPAPGTWHFLTGPVPEVARVLEWFGVAAFPDEGLMDHSLHTVLIDRHQRLFANIEGNQYSTDQLAQLTRAVLKSR